MILPFGRPLVLLLLALPVWLLVRTWRVRGGGVVLPFDQAGRGRGDGGTQPCDPAALEGVFQRTDEMQQTEFVQLAPEAVSLHRHTSAVSSVFTPEGLRCGPLPRVLY